MDEKTAVERLKKQYSRQNEYIKNNYDRLAVVVPSGTKERIKAVLEEGTSINSFVTKLIEKELKRLEKQKNEQDK